MHTPIGFSGKYALKFVLAGWNKKIIIIILINLRSIPIINHYCGSLLLFLCCVFEHVYKSICKLLHTYVHSFPYYDYIPKLSCSIAKTSLIVYSPIWVTHLVILQVLSFFTFGYIQVNYMSLFDLILSTFCYCADIFEIKYDILRSILSTIQL